MSSRPKKELGQHWLYDEISLEAVADAGHVQAGDRVIEIGPGLGTLTEVLLQREAEVYAVEFDNELATNLQDRFKADSVTIINEDILQFDFSKIQAPYKVVGNIPYYLTSKLIRNLLELKNQPEAIGLLIQKEVAQRIVSKPGKMSILSVSAQLYADCSVGPEVPARLFTPPPKVDSQVVQLIPKDLPEGLDTKYFFKIIKAGFGEKRKKLINSLSGGLQYSKEQIREIVIACGHSENTRAQELGLDDWVQLQNELKRLKE